MTRLTHEQARHYLHAGQDQLNAAERAELDGHLAGCLECRSYAAELASFWPMLTHAMHARWDAPRPAPGRERRVQAQVGKRLLLWRFRSLAGPWVTAGVGIAAIVLLVFLLFAAGPFADRPQSASAPEASASVTPPTENQVNRAGPTPLPGLAVFGDQITLLESSLADYPHVPGGTLSLTLRWQTSTPIETPYTVFVRLLDAARNPVAQSDAVPDGGARPTMRWRPGETIEDRHLLVLPDDLAAGPYQLVVGLYDSRTGERLFASDGQVVAQLATIEVQDIAHRIDEDFGDFATLLGSNLASEGVAPGGVAELTLYWRVSASTDTLYVVAVQVLDANEASVAQADTVPAGGTRPTTTWQPGEIVVDPVAIQLPGDVPQGQYSIVLTMYDSVSGAQVFTGVGNGAVVLATLDVQETTSTPAPTPTTSVVVTSVTFSPDPAVSLDRSAGASLDAELAGNSTHGVIAHIFAFPVFAGETLPDCGVQEEFLDRLFLIDQQEFPPGPFTFRRSFSVSREVWPDADWFVMRVNVIEPDVPSRILACRQQVYRLSPSVASLTPTSAPLPAGPTSTVAPTTTPPPASWTPFPTATPVPPSPSPTPLSTSTPTPEAGGPTPSITFTPPPTPADSPTPFPTFTPTP